MVLSQNQPLIEIMRGGRFLLKFLLVGIALFQFDSFSIAPMFATGASSVKVERHVGPEKLSNCKRAIPTSRNLCRKRAPRMVSMSGWFRLRTRSFSWPE